MPYIIIGSIVLAILVIVGLLLFFVEFVFSLMLPKRGDGCLCIDYPHPDEYKEMAHEKIEFKSGKNLLRGFIYKNTNIKDYKAVVILAHGIGYGHFYMLDVINFLTVNGYIVMAYDHYASGYSEGRILNCMTKVSKGMEDALKFKENNEVLKGYSTYLFGHSLGGFAAMSGLNIKGYKVEKCISVAGFNSEQGLCISVAPKLAFLKPFIVLRNFLLIGKTAFLL
ncbi:MAG: alpha/beta hydrolase, partial [Bacilli bacterium]|nr:alpha/beta hydrolase [Bacilli bacterium]